MAIFWLLNQPIMALLGTNLIVYSIPITVLLDHIRIVAPPKEFCLVTLYLPPVIYTPNS